MDFDVASGQIDALIAELDGPVDGLPQDAIVAIGLGLRASALYQTVGRLAGQAADSAGALIVLRALVELVILIRWLEARPALHLRLWQAEDERHRLTFVEAHAELLKRRGRPPVKYFEPFAVDAMRDEIRSARVAARRAGVNLPAKGSVLPRIEDMAGAAPELWEAYHIAYRTLSPWSHSHLMAFSGDQVEVRADGSHIVSTAPISSESTRALAATSMCVAIESVSRLARLGIADEARAIRDALTEWQPG